MTGTVTIVSGGMDSVTLLHLLAHLHPSNELAALSVDYGQRHKKELQFAKDNAELLGVSHRVVDLTAITPLISNSSLTGNNDVPNGHYTDESMKITVVPNRNMIMLAVAIGLAENNGWNRVAIGNHAGDHAIYPDCRTEFVDALSTAAQLGTYSQVALYTPFTNISKTDIASLGLALGVDYNRTWSCYKGGDVHCHTCGTCVERDEALRDSSAERGQQLLLQLSH